MLDYENIPFRCRKFHALGNLFRDYPLNKLLEQSKSQADKDEEGFKKYLAKRKN
jgi:hypothetical protein